MEHCDCRRKKCRDPEEEKALVCRLRRIEGQIRGIIKMVENDAWCPDILRQSTAAREALSAFNRVLLEEHIRTCVTRDLVAGKTETAEELVQTLRSMMK